MAHNSTTWPPNVRVVAASLIGCAVEDVAAGEYRVDCCVQSRHSLGIVLKPPDSSREHATPDRAVEATVSSTEQPLMQRAARIRLTIHQAFERTYRVTLVLVHCHRGKLLPQLRMLTNLVGKPRPLLR
jgi:hypothetical protein